ncbi:hypothetical protein [Spirosoma pomorum]
MASQAQFRERINKAKSGADIKAVIESTGAQPVHSNAAKGEYMYHAPYREDTDPSLKINVHLQKFIDYGMNGAEGDVIELTRRIFGKGDINAMPFMEAIQWLERFSGASLAPTAVKPRQRPEKPVQRPLVEGERFTFVKATPVTAKTHPSNLGYITQNRGISLPIASRHLQVITYKDHQAAFDDPLRGNRYGIGGQNDAGGFEVRAPSPNSDFKTSLGPKDITTYRGQPTATTGDVFEGRFDALTYWEMTGQTEPANPTIILNTGRLAARAADAILTRPEWQAVTHWRIWQQNDDEGQRVTGVICDAVSGQRHIGTMETHYEGFNDLNQFWTSAPDQQRNAFRAQLAGCMQPGQKAYDTSAGTEARRTNDAQRGPSNNPSFT